MLTIESLTVDAREPEGLAVFWAALLGGWTVNRETVGGEVEIWISPPDGTAASEILFVPNVDEKAVKNRLHLDLRPTDQRAEVDRAMALGATRVDIGQTGTESWVVLADPEGNEFCILRDRWNALDKG